MSTETEKPVAKYSTGYVVKNVETGNYFHVTMHALATDIQVASRFPYADSALAVSRRLGTKYRVIKVNIDKQTGEVTLRD